MRTLTELKALTGPALALSAAVFALPAPVRGQTVDQVIARYLQARGGTERIHAVQTLRLSGTMTLPDVLAPLVLELKRPNRMRTEFVFQGHTGVRAFDGTTAWMILPVPSMDRPQVMPPDEAEDARDQADIDLSPLVDPAAKGFAVELLGRETSLGKETLIKLSVRTRDRPVRTMYLDAKSYLVTRIEEMRSIEGKPEPFETLVGDYRTVSGLVFPHALEVGPRRGGDRQKFVFEKIEVNVPLDDSRFTMPTPPR